MTEPPLADVETSQAALTPWWRKVLVAGDGRVRSVWAIAAFFMALMVTGNALEWIVRALKLSAGPLGALPLTDPRFALRELVRVVNVLVASLVGAAVLRGRLRDVGFAHPRPGRQFGIGALAGVALLTASVVIAVLSGHERTSGPSFSWEVMEGGARLLLVFVLVGVAEEVGMRGFFLQQLRRGFGRLGPRVGNVAAVFITGALFGLGHSGNPNVSSIAIANIALGGWLLGALVVRTGSLWLPIGMHTAWNFTQGYLWGEPVSGVMTGATLMHRTGFDDSMWTGGRFGPEATIQLAALMALALAGLVFWRPRAQPAAASNPIR